MRSWRTLLGGCTYQIGLRNAYGDGGLPCKATECWCGKQGYFHGRSIPPVLGEVVDEEEVATYETISGRADRKNDKFTDFYQGVHLAWNPVRSDDSWKTFNNDVEGASTRGSLESQVSIMCKDSIEVGRALTRALADVVQCAPEPRRNTRQP